MPDAQRCITFFGTKGGVGKTLLATNVAVALAAGQPAGSVALVDLDLVAVGDAAHMLKLNPRITIADWAATGVKSGEARPVSEIALPHASGVHFFAAVRSPAQANVFNIHWIEPLFTELRHRYRYIIVDGGRTLSDALIAAFEESNLILLVLTPDVLSLYQTKWSLNFIEDLHADRIKRAHVAEVVKKIRVGPVRRHPERP